MTQAFVLVVMSVAFMCCCCAKTVDAEADADDAKHHRPVLSDSAMPEAENVRLEESGVEDLDGESPGGFKQSSRHGQSSSSLSDLIKQRVHDADEARPNDEHQPLSRTPNPIRDSLSEIPLSPSKTEVEDNDPHRGHFGDFVEQNPRLAIQDILQSDEAEKRSSSSASSPVQLNPTLESKIRRFIGEKSEQDPSYVRHHKQFLLDLVQYLRQRKANSAADDIKATLRRQLAGAAPAFNVTVGSANTNRRLANRMAGPPSSASDEVKSPSPAGDEMREDFVRRLLTASSAIAAKGKDVRARLINWKIVNHGKQTIILL